MSKDVAVLGKGCSLEIDIAASMTLIKGARNFSFDEGGAGDVEKKDVTSHSTSGMVREKIDGFSELRDGSLSFDLVYDALDSAHAALRAAAVAGTDEDFQLTINTKTAPGTKVGTFTGRVSGFPVELPYDDAITVKPTITISSAGVTWA